MKRREVFIRDVMVRKVTGSTGNILSLFNKNLN